MLTDNNKISELYKAWEELQNNQQNISKSEFIEKAEELKRQINKCLEDNIKKHKKQEFLLNKLLKILYL